MHKSFDHGTGPFFGPAAGLSSLRSLVGALGWLGSCAGWLFEEGLRLADAGQAHAGRLKPRDFGGKFIGISPIEMRILWVSIGVPLKSSILVGVSLINHPFY